MKLLSLLALVGFAFVVGCETVEEEEQNNKILYTKKSTSNKSLLFHLSNNDIKWGGGKVGLEPTVTGKPGEMLLSRGKSITPYLLRGLKDPDKFAACHVLLTKVNLDGYFPLDFKKWNGLTVKRKGKGEVEYDSAQIPDLVTFWQKALEAKKRERIEKAGGQSE
jgi:hypothetical protein